MKYILTSLLLFIGINCLSQEAYQLNIKVSGNMPSFEYIFDIHRDKENVKIYFSEYTGERNKLSESDMIKIDLLRHKKDRIAAENKEMERIFNSYKIFSTECFNFSSKDPIIHISDSIINSKEEILNEIESNKNHIVLDAQQIRVTAKPNNGNEYSYNIHAPDYTHHKLFAQFVDEVYKVLIDK